MIRHSNRMLLRRWSLLFAIVSLVVVPVCLAGEGDDKPSAEKTETVKKESDDSAKKKDKKPEKKDRYFALKGGTVHTITNGTLGGVTILCKNGKVIEIGESLELPEDTEVLDAAGFKVYPGLVAVASGGILGSGSPDDNADVYSLQMTLGLATGITTAVQGNTAAKLTFGSLDDIIVKRNLFETLRYSTSDPKSRYELRKKFEKVRQYMRDSEAFEEEKKMDPEAEEPEKDWLKGEYQTLLGLMRHETVADITANSVDELRAVCDLVNRYQFDAIVRGAVEGWIAASEMARAGLSAIVSPRRPTQSDEKLNRPNGPSIENAAILHEHGVPLAIVPSNTSITLWGVAGRDLFHLNMEAAFAVRGGLPEEAAIRAITIDAARLLGIDHRVGSIELGKDADFVITDGPLLHYMTHARWTIVNGRVAYDKQKDTLFDHIRPNGDRHSPPPDDYWPRVLGADQ